MRYVAHSATEWHLQEHDKEKMSVVAEEAVSREDVDVTLP